MTTSNRIGGAIDAPPFPNQVKENMNLLGLTLLQASQVLEDELFMYKSNRFRLTLRLRVLKRVGTDEETLNALLKDLERLEHIIGEYEQEIKQLGT